MNYADSERVFYLLESAGLEERESYLDSEIVIFNTCSIKQKAEDKVYSMINNVSKKRRKENTEKKILLTGCMVKKTSIQESEEKDPLLKKFPEIDCVFRIEDTPKLLELLNIGKDQKLESYFDIPQKYSNKYQAIVPIQTGCDNFCTFCVVPYTRGREVSRNMDSILREIKALARNGCKEVTLVGQNVNSYGKGLPGIKRQFDEENNKWTKGNAKTPFTLLLEEVNKIEGIERIRFQSSNPHDMTDDIIEAICTTEKVMPHLHFALQSGDDEILQKMNRKHSYADYKDIVDKIRNLRPDFAITTDIIVGFSGESENAFQKTIQAMQDTDPDLIYISPYSLRKGTAAAKTIEDNVHQSVKKERFHILNNWLKDHISKKLKTLVSKKFKVLVENINEKGEAEGKTEHNRQCIIKDQNLSVGDIVEVEVTKSSTWSLEGKLV